jgi:hypothetical protein
MEQIAIAHQVLPSNREAQSIVCYVLLDCKFSRLDDPASGEHCLLYLVFQRCSYCTRNILRSWRFCSYVYRWRH